jgi:hypothetical protein
VKNISSNSILIGDFNLPGIDWVRGTATSGAREFLDVIHESFLDQLVTFHTQIKGNILDLVLTNARELIETVMAEGRLGKSDHEMIKIVLSDGQQGKKKVGGGHDWSRADWALMKNELANLDLYEQLADLNTEQTWSRIKTVLDDLVLKFVPQRKQRHPGKPLWMNREISRVLGRKRRLWHKLRGGTPTEEYKDADKKVRNLIRNAKRNFEKKLAANNGNSRPFYAYLKQKTSSRSSIGPPKNKDNFLISDNKN